MRMTLHIWVTVAIITMSFFSVKQMVRGILFVSQLCLPKIVGMS